MRRVTKVLIVVMVWMAAWSFPLAMAGDDLPRTFGGCVRNGGNVRMVDDELTCRLVRSYDFRVYGTGTTECGEEIQLEIWGETRAGVVTYLLEPGKTVELPEIGEEEMTLPERPFPCLDGQESDKG